MTESNELNANLNTTNLIDILDEATKDELLQNRKALNTNRTTKQWISCLNAFLKERQLPDVDSLDLEQLPQIIGDFYFSVRKKKITDDGTEPTEKEAAKAKLKHYKNSSLKSGRAALTDTSKEHLD